MENSLARGTIEALIAEDVLADALPHRFTHPILRDAVFDDAPHATRAREHADAARMLLGEGAESLAAHHLRLGEPQGDPAVDRARRRGNAMLFARASALRGWVSLR